MNVVKGAKKIKPLSVLCSLTVHLSVRMLLRATGSQDGGLLQAWDASRRLVRGVRRRLGADENDILPIRVRFTLSPLYIHVG